MARDPLEVRLGPHPVGEIPENIVFQARNADRVQINLTGATVHGAWSVAGSPSKPFTPVIEDEVAGQIRVAWTAEQFARPGRFVANVWVIDNGLKLTVAKFRDHIYTPDVALT